MPTSAADTQPQVKKIIAELQPETVLDLCCGSGQYGPILRSILGKGARIDAVEIHGPYIGEVHHEHYDAIFICDALRFLHEIRPPVYDLALCIGSIEHFTEDDGIGVLRGLQRRAKHAVVVTPMGFTKQGKSHGNPYEEHLSGWEPEDFTSRGWEIVPHRRAVIAKWTAPPPRKDGLVPMPAEPPALPFCPDCGAVKTETHESVGCPMKEER